MVPSLLYYGVLNTEMRAQTSGRGNSDTIGIHTSRTANLNWTAPGVHSCLQPAVPRSMLAAHSMCEYVYSVHRDYNIDITL